MTQNVHDIREDFFVTVSTVLEGIAESKKLNLSVDELENRFNIGYKTIKLMVAITDDRLEEFEQEGYDGFKKDGDS